MFLHTDPKRRKVLMRHGGVSGTAEGAKDADQDYQAGEHQYDAEGDDQAA